MIQTIQEWWKFEEKTPDIPKEILIKLKFDDDKIYKGYYSHMSKTVESKNGFFIVEDIALWSYPVIPKEKE